MGNNDDLYEKRYRYFGNGRTGTALDSFTAKLEAGKAAGMSAYEARALQSMPTPMYTTPSISPGSQGIISQPVDPTQGSYGQTKSTYGGVPAQRRDVAFSNQALQPGFSLEDVQRHIDYSETGVLTGVLIAVNDPNFVITLRIYGDTGTYIELWNNTVEQLSVVGRGLTHQQAQAVAVGKYPYSLDIPGTKDDTWPWLRRARSTISLNAMQKSLSQKDVVGTSDDIWWVMDYTPAVKEGYSRIFLDVTNQGNNVNGMLLQLQLSRIVFQPVITPVYESASGDAAYVLEPELEFGGGELY